jgi:hypothetical protein
MEAKEEKEEIPSVFQKKYDEFVDDLLGTLPEYKRQILLAQSIPAKLRLDRFQAEVKFKNTMGGGLPTLLPCPKNIFVAERKKYTAAIKYCPSSMFWTVKSPDTCMAATSELL